MRSAPLFFFILAGGVALVTAVNFGLSTAASNKTVPGCPGVTTDGSPNPAETAAFWMDTPVAPQLLTYSDSLSPAQIKVLGASSDEKWIEVDLSDQKLTAWEGNRVFLQTLISSGLRNRTPAGEYRIWYKTRATKMEGGSRLNKTYYYLPNVPFAMFFHGDYGIHGTYWHNNFGNRMSHGCVNAPTPEAERLFYWTQPELPAGKKSVRSDAAHPGTRVVVHE